MSHIYADGQEDWQSVPGQYERTFIGQSTGTVTWEVKESMKDFYWDDREAARERRTGKGNYANAVFATDKLLQGDDDTWTIKSGYYFNPGGTYTCTIKTAQYKDTDVSTEEHKELVKKIRAAFYYESDLLYVHASASQPPSKLGKIRYSENPDSAYAKGLLKIDEKYTLKTPIHKLPTTLTRGGNIDPLLREVLEGYEESGTGYTYEEYLYREYTNKQIYLVEETTVLTYKIGKPASADKSQNLYTHVNMKNGNYAVMAKVGKIEFDFEDYLEIDNAYKANSVLSMEAFNLDGIRVTVRGSIHDD
jgi:hypothetical protein